jgi:hypothetical protein
MIQANELRIGNLVQTNQGAFKVFCIYQENARLSPFLAEETNVRDYDDISPIPLTEEWLLRFGFKKRLGVPDYFIGDRLKGSDFRINFSRNPVLIEFNYKELIDVKIQYVHQLQNFFFALTGTELELKP